MPTSLTRSLSSVQAFNIEEIIFRFGL